MRGARRFGDAGSRAARTQIAAAHDHVDGHFCQASPEASGDLLPQWGERVGVVLVASLEGVGGVRLTLAVANDNELLVVSHAAIRSRVARMNSWVTSTSRLSLGVVQATLPMLGLEHGLHQL